MSITGSTNSNAHATEFSFDVIAAARDIVPRLAEISDRSEQLRRLDDEAASILRASGLTRVITPKKFGGFEMSPSAHIRACAEVAHGCGAASWVLMVCVAHDYVIGRFPEECQREVYDGDGDNLIAGTLSPQGTVERTAGGWRLNGRWQFGSGCDHSPWFLMGARVINPEPNGFLTYHVVAPRSDIQFDDTWRTLGMRGTGSKDLIADNVFVPDHRAVPTYPTFLGQSPHASAPTYRLPVFAGLSSMLSGTVLGMAERGLEAFVQHTKGRRDMSGPKGANANMQQRVAESSAEVASARRLLESMCKRFDAAMARDDGPMPLAERVQLRWDAATVVELSRRAIERLFAAAGAHGIYEGDPIHRAYRDISTACHHAIVDFDNVSELQGKSILLGDAGENQRGMPVG